MINYYSFSLNFAARARSVENGQAKKHNDAEYVKMREVVCFLIFITFFDYRFFNHYLL